MDEWRQWRELGCSFLLPRHPLVSAENRVQPYSESNRITHCICDSKPDSNSHAVYDAERNADTKSNAISQQYSHCIAVDDPEFDVNTHAYTDENPNENV